MQFPPWNKKFNIANCHDRLKQIPVSSAVCLLLTVLCPELWSSFLLMIQWSCFELIHTNCESVICPEVIWCGLQGIKIQTLTNQKKKQSKEKGTLHNIKNNRTTCSSIFMFCQPHQLGHLWMNHTYSRLLYTRSKHNYQTTLKKLKLKKGSQFYTKHNQ